MNRPFQAIFEAGVLKPLEPLSPNEHEVVRLVVAQRDGLASADEPADDDIIDERGDY